MFPKRFILLFIIYELCGYQTGMFKRRSIATIFFLLHGILAAIFTYEFFCFVQRLDIIVQAIFIVNEIQQYSSSLAAYWLVLIESYFKRKTEQKFWILLAHIEKGEENIKKFKFWKHVLQSIHYFITTNIILYTTSYEYFNDYFLLISYLIVIGICQNRVFHYIFHLKVIEFELKLIESDLRDFFKKPFDLEAAQREIGVKRIRESYRLVFEMVECINSVFSWSYLATILFCFHFLITEMYFSYSNPFYTDLEGRTHRN